MTPVSGCRIRPNKVDGQRASWMRTADSTGRVDGSAASASLAFRRLHERTRPHHLRLGGLVDELHVAIAPILLGYGEHVFAGVDAVKLGYHPAEHVTAAKATHVVLTRSG